MPPSTKLGCTLGPETRDVAILEELLRAGMSVGGAHKNAQHC